MTKRLEGKVALITGGTGGIGEATLELFLKEGAKVAAVGTNDEKLKKLKERFPDILTLKADVSKEEEVKSYVEKTLETFGKIDVFFNNAGIEGKINNLVDQSLEDYQRVIDINVTGVFLGMKYVIPVMQKQGNGSIINTSSVAGLIGSPGLSPYVASKHAVAGLTKTASLELAKENIRVNSIHPAPVNTRMMESIEKLINPQDAEAARKAFEDAVPMGRYAEPIEIANVVLFLASDESSFVTGSQYTVDGGMID